MSHYHPLIMTERPGLRKLGAWGITKSTCNAEPSASRPQALVYEGVREDGLSLLGLFSQEIWLLSLTCLEGWCCLACTRLQAFVATSHTHCSIYCPWAWKLYSWVSFPICLVQCSGKCNLQKDLFGPQFQGYSPSWWGSHGSRGWVTQLVTRHL